MRSTRESVTVSCCYLMTDGDASRSEKTARALFAMYIRIQRHSHGMTGLFNPGEVIGQ
jgi:hypothetical protein